MTSTTKTTKTLLDLLQLAAGEAFNAISLDTGRVTRADRIRKRFESELRDKLEDWEGLDGAAFGWQSTCPSETDGSRYEMTAELKVIDRDDAGKLAIEVRLSCECESWKTGKMHKPQVPCKHLLALAPLVTLPAAIKLADLGTVITPNPFGEGESVPAGSAPVSTEWRDRISGAIQAAVGKLARDIWAMLEGGQVPLVIGPTGCGKTSAARLVATDMLGGRLIEHSGADSYTDSDMVGFVHANGERFPGPVAQACEAARFEGNTLLFLDEFTRYNRRVQDGLMNFILATPAAVAQAMGYETSEAIHRATAPFWGDTWAPVSGLRLVLAANPWGTDLDPALVRRTEPLLVDFDLEVGKLLKGKLQEAVLASWQAHTDGILPLPIEYQALAFSTGPEDLAVVGRYVRRLQVLDSAAAEGYLATLAGLKIKPEEIGIQKKSALAA